MNIEHYNSILKSCGNSVQLIAVSKTKPAADILSLYQYGQRAFGENKALEMRDKHAHLPSDIQWHFIGHLQSNKIKYIAPFVSLIHSIDSFELLKEVDKQAAKNERIIPCLLQFHIAQEETKFGFNLEECKEMLNNPEFLQLTHIKLFGIMGMATFTSEMNQVRQEFATLHNIFQQLKSQYFINNEEFKEISMGMSEDYEVAIKEGSTMIRIGSSIFGARDYSKSN